MMPNITNTNKNKSKLEITSSMNQTILTDFISYHDRLFAINIPLDIFELISSWFDHVIIILYIDIKELRIDIEALKVKIEDKETIKIDTKIMRIVIDLQLNFQKIKQVISNQLKLDDTKKFDSKIPNLHKQLKDYLCPIDYGLINNQILIAKGIRNKWNDDERLFGEDSSSDDDSDSDRFIQNCNNHQHIRNNVQLLHSNVQTPNIVSTNGLQPMSTVSPRA